MPEPDQSMPQPNATAEVSARQPAFGFRPLREADFPLMLRWLTTPHVRQWWFDEPQSADGVAEKYGPVVTGAEPTNGFIITADDVSIGYIQYLVIADYPEYAAAIAIPERAAGVDVFIGEAAFLHRGLGAPIIRAFLRQVVFARPDVECCLIAPEVANTAAIRAYEKAGFRYVKTIDVPGEPKPEYVMRLGRDEFVVQNALPSGAKSG